MKKMKFYMNAAASAMLAFGMTACNAVQDNPGGAAENPANQGVAIQSGDTLATIISQLAVTAGDEVVVEIPAGIEVASGDIVTPYGKQVTIVSDKENPATIKLTNSIILSNKIAVKDVNINAAAIEDNVFKYNAEVDESLLGATGIGDMYNIVGEAVKLENANIDSIPRGLLSDGGVKYVPEQVIIDGCILHFVPATGNQNAIHFNTSNNAIKELTIKNTTAYATGGKRLGYFVKYSNNARIDRLGYDEKETSCLINYENNTFYGLCSNYFHNYNNFMNKGTNFIVKKNVFYYDNGNFQQTRQIIQRIVVRPAAVTGELVFDGNAFLYNGTPYDCNQPSNKQSNDIDTNSISLDPKFKDPENGNFRPTDALFLNLGNKRPGDPRWVGGVRADLL